MQRFMKQDTNNEFINAMNNITIKSNMTETENGAITHKSTESAIVDFFFHGAALRSEQNENRIVNLFTEAFKEDPTTALRILFYIRDIRNGQGERRVFRTILKNLAFKQSNWLANNLQLIPKYGRWDDLFTLVGTPLEYRTLCFIRNQLAEDCIRQNRNESISLLAKWLPSENTSSTVTRQLAYKIRTFLYDKPKVYRKVLSKLRKHIDIVERKLSAKQYNEINYSTVPSNAGLKYKKVFMKRDTERYKEYIASTIKGEAKINTSTLYPYDLVHKAMNAYDDTVEALWKNLPDYVSDISGLVVADTSGSMFGRPIEVSISLAMYIAERNKNEAFKDYFISFSNHPKFHKIKGNNLKEKIKSVNLGDISTTNLQVVFEMILNRAKEYEVLKENMPKTLLVISDMEFNRACGRNKITNYQAIQQKYNMYGYDMPTLVFWNVNSRNNQSPITINDNGVVLIGGCSPVILKYALNSCTNIFDIIYNVVNKYDDIFYT